MNTPTCCDPSWWNWSRALDTQKQGFQPAFCSASCCSKQPKFCMVGFKTRSSKMRDVTKSDSKSVGIWGGDHRSTKSWTSFLSPQLLVHRSRSLWAVGLYWDHFRLFWVTPGFSASPKKCFKQALLDCNSKDAPGARSVKRFSILFTRSHSLVSALQRLATTRMVTRSLPTKIPCKDAVFSSVSKRCFTFLALISRLLSEVDRSSEATSCLIAQILLSGLLVSNKSLKGNLERGSTTRREKADACCKSTAKTMSHNHAESSFSNCPPKRFQDSPGCFPQVF